LVSIFGLEWRVNRVIWLRLSGLNLTDEFWRFSCRKTTEEKNHTSKGQMARASVRTTTFGRSRRAQAASRAVSRARSLLRARNARAVSGILRTGGFRGPWNGRGAAELKYKDDTLTTNVPTTGTINLISGVAAGTDVQQRVGRKMTMKSILLRYFINPVSTATAPSGDVVRVMLVYDTQTNGALPLVADILQNVTVQSPMNLNNRDRFKVLYDHWVSMNANLYTAGALTAGSPGTKFYKTFKSFSLDTIFSGTAATIGSIATGAIYIVTVGAANNASNFAGETRIRFIDN